MSSSLGKDSSHDEAVRFSTARAALSKIQAMDRPCRQEMYSWN